ncbi:hypothetical protein IWQ62_004247 [Dispira parvispora]|uniref:DUF4034 domain-containing protein n=1 Tax=Dispira parvispora TaxID=1520584 RepID=A0A9W8E0V1_9FUNG|nr:hypothetical protein IWQ62_004247 [Dispira parvispora]
MRTHVALMLGLLALSVSVQADESSATASTSSSSAEPTNPVSENKNQDIQGNPKGRLNDMYGGFHEQVEAYLPVQGTHALATASKTTFRVGNSLNGINEVNLQWANKLDLESAKYDKDPKYRTQFTDSDQMSSLQFCKNEIQWLALAYARQQRAEAPQGASQLASPFTMTGSEDEHRQLYALHLDFSDVSPKQALHLSPFNYALHFLNPRLLSDLVSAWADKILKSRWNDADSVTNAQIQPFIVGWARTVEKSQSLHESINNNFRYYMYDRVIAYYMNMNKMDHLKKFLDTPSTINAYFQKHAYSIALGYALQRDTKESNAFADKLKAENPEIVSKHVWQNWACYIGSDRFVKIRDAANAKLGPTLGEPTDILQQPVCSTLFAFGGKDVLDPIMYSEYSAANPDFVRGLKTYREETWQALVKVPEGEQEARRNLVRTELV